MWDERRPLLAVDARVREGDVCEMPLETGCFLFLSAKRERRRSVVGLDRRSPAGRAQATVSFGVLGETERELHRRRDADSDDDDDEETDQSKRWIWGLFREGTHTTLKKVTKKKRTV